MENLKKMNELKEHLENKMSKMETQMSEKVTD